MLNKLLTRLNGHATDVDALIAALADIGRERDTARSELGELQVRRHQALLDDATDAALDKLEREIARKEIALEKLDMAEPGVRERLTAAQKEARQRRWQELRAAYVDAAGEFIASARVTIDKHNTVVAIVDQAQRAGFAGEVAATLPLTPNVNGHALLAPDALDAFERAITPPAAPARRVAATKAPKLPLPRGTSLQHAISLAPSHDPQVLTARRAADDLTPLEPGEARVLALHSGWCPRENAPQCHAGQRLKMTAAAATAAANRGQVEILEMNVDRTDVQGATWQRTDPSTGLTILGSGGQSIVRANPSPPGAPASEQVGSQK